MHCENAIQHRTWSMQLTEFWKGLSPEILLRGNEYYLRGHIADVQEGGQGHWKAVVEGLQSYEVEVKIEGEEWKSAEIHSAECDCPFEGTCKHLVAVLAALHAIYESRAVARQHGHLQRPGAFPGFKSWLARHADELEQDSLVEFIGEYGKWDAEFRRQFREWLEKARG